MLPLLSNPLYSKTFGKGFLHLQPSVVLYHLLWNCIYMTVGVLVVGEMLIDEDFSQFSAHHSPTSQDLS